MRETDRGKQTGRNGTSGNEREDEPVAVTSLLWVADAPNVIVLCSGSEISIAGRPNARRFISFISAVPTPARHHIENRTTLKSVYKEQDRVSNTINRPCLAYK